MGMGYCLMIVMLWNWSGFNIRGVKFSEYAIREVLSDSYFLFLIVCLPSFNFCFQWSDVSKHDDKLCPFQIFLNLVLKFTVPQSDPNCGFRCSHVRLGDICCLRIPLNFRPADTSW
jgi:hypothetical protein